jgi:LacI family transcriptional regulator
MDERHPTLRDVARKCGLSISTVSRVVIDHPDVSEETRARVKAAIQELGYRPSTLARGLVGGKTYSLGLLVSDIRNPFYPHLAAAIEDVASVEGYIVLLCNTHDDPQRTQEYVRRLIDHRVDGLIHGSVIADDEVMQELAKFKMPLVLVNRRPKEEAGYDLIVADNVEGSRKGTNHLIELGHRRIAFIGGPEYASVSWDRLRGYREALTEAGIEIDESLIRVADFTRQSGFWVARELLLQSPRPTGILAINDVVALGVLDAALDQGLNIPQDISIVGFDNIEITGLGPLRLTTISTQIREMGRLACQRLLGAILRPEKHEICTITLETQLVIRDTTSQVPGARV